MTVSRFISSVLNFHVSNKLERSNHGHCYKTMFQDPYRMQLKCQLKANCSEISLCVTHSCSGNVATEKAWRRILFAKCKSMHQKQLEQIRAFCTKAVKRCGCYSSLEVTENPGFEVKKYRWDTAQCAACNTGIHITHPLLCSCTYLQQGCPLSATCVRDRVSEQTTTAICSQGWEAAQVFVGGCRMAERIIDELSQSAWLHKSSSWLNNSSGWL